jgi:biopolymer transport protein ExbD
VSSKKRHTDAEVAPNLIPMVDIMFLLLLFFMLGADMGQRDLEEVSLPVANSVKEDKDSKKEKERLTINICHRSLSEAPCANLTSGQPCRNERHWKIVVRGEDLTDLQKLTGLLKEEAELHQTDVSGKASERRVMIRADGSSPYGYIQDVMGLCAQVGIYQIECGAARPPQGGKT